MGHWGESRSAPRAQGDPPPLRISRRTLLALSCAGVVSACGGGHGERATPGEPTASQPTPGELYYGAAVPSGGLAKLESDIDSRLSCHRTYFVAGQEHRLFVQARGDLRHGRLPLVSIKPPTSWARTATHTAWLDSLVEPLSDLSGPVYLIIHHEPENDAAAYGTAGDFVTMQRAALARAALAGTNVTVVPVLSSWSFDDSASRRPEEWNVEEAPVYGVDLYNPWSPTNGAEWISFSDRLALSVPTAAGRPIVVGEYGCRSDPAQPGRAAEWLVDAFSDALSEGVVAMAYFDSYRNTPDETWELDAETLPVFARLMQSDQVARLRIA
jgi:hypothetical protein